MYHLSDCSTALISDVDEVIAFSAAISRWRTKAEWNAASDQIK